MAKGDEEAFAAFFADAEPKLRRALVAGYGPDVGRDAAAEALTLGWRDWVRVSQMQNPAGYLYRAGERWARRQKPRSVALLAGTTTEPLHFEPGLESALNHLSLRQRQVVVLVSGFGLSHSEAAELLGLSRSSIQNHVERGMTKLRHHLGAPL